MSHANDAINWIERNYKMVKAAPYAQVHLAPVWSLEGDETLCGRKVSAGQPNLRLEKACKKCKDIVSRLADEAIKST